MYASGTTVPIERSRAELERILKRYGASELSTFNSNVTAAVGFVAHGRRVRFTLQLSDGSDAPEKVKRRRYNSKVRGYQSAEARQDIWADKENRRRWRALLLSIKAKLEAVSSGVAGFDEEFLANIVTPGGESTVYEVLKKFSANNKGLALLPPVTQ